MFRTVSARASISTKGRALFKAYDLMKWNMEQLGGPCSVARENECQHRYRRLRQEGGQEGLWETEPRADR